MKKHFVTASLACITLLSCQQATRENQQYPEDTLHTAIQDSPALPGADSAQANSDEPAMLDNPVNTYVSTDGKRLIQVGFYPDAAGKPSYIEIKTGAGGPLVRYDFVENQGDKDIYSSRYGTVWESREYGGSGSLIEKDKRTEFVIR